MTNETENIESDVVEKETVQKKKSTCQSERNPEIFSRIFYTILLGIIGWMSLWVFCFVVLIQFGFLLITGQINTNLKGFNKEVGLYLNDLVKFLSFQTNEKPFPFRDWPYDANSNNENKSELNDSEAVKTSK
jgi:hypothetical protein